MPTPLHHSPCSPLRQHAALSLEGPGGSHQSSVTAGAGTPPEQVQPIQPSTTPKRGLKSSPQHTASPYQHQVKQQGCANQLCQQGARGGLGNRNLHSLLPSAMLTFSETYLQAQKREWRRRSLQGDGKRASPKTLQPARVN